jgi:hypothetical protein
MSILKNFVNPWGLDTGVLDTGVLDTDVLETSILNKEGLYTTHLYSTHGEYLKSYTTTKGMFYTNNFYTPEIHFIDKNVYNKKIKGKKDNLETVNSVRSLSKFYIGNNAKKIMLEIYSRGKKEKKEKGGLMFHDAEEIPTNSKDWKESDTKLIFHDEEEFLGGTNYENGETPFLPSKELQLEECTKCTPGGNMALDGLLSTSNYEHCNYRIYRATFHTHPPEERSSEPSGIRGWANIGRDDLRYGDIYVVEDQYITTPIHLLSGGLGIIASMYGLSIYRHSGDIYKMVKVYDAKGSQYTTTKTGEKYDPYEETTTGKYTYYTHTWNNFTIKQHIGGH